jgi:hypothetical protein
MPDFTPGDTGLSGTGNGFGAAGFDFEWAAM